MSEGGKAFDVIKHKSKSAHPAKLFSGHPWIFSKWAHLYNFYSVLSNSQKSSVKIEKQSKQKYVLNQLILNCALRQTVIFNELEILIFNKQFTVTLCRQN